MRRAHVMEFLKTASFFCWSCTMWNTFFFRIFWREKKHHIKRKPLVLQTWQHHRWSFVSVFYDERKSGSTCWYGDIAFQRTIRFMFLILCVFVEAKSVTWKSHGHNAQYQLAACFTCCRSLKGNIFPTYSNHVWRGFSHQLGAFNMLEDLCSDREVVWQAILRATQCS